MKKLIFIIILLSVPVAGASKITKIINWINSREYNRVQLEQNLTWPKMEAAAINRNIDPNEIKSCRNTIKNAVWSDFWVRRAENIRGGLEVIVLGYNSDGIVSYGSVQQYSRDPNRLSDIFITEIPR